MSETEKKELPLTGRWARLRAPSPRPSPGGRERQFLRSPVAASTTEPLDASAAAPASHSHSEPNHSWATRDPSSRAKAPADPRSAERDRAPSPSARAQR